MDSLTFSMMNSLEKQQLSRGSQDELFTPYPLKGKDQTGWYCSLALEGKWTCIKLTKFFFKLNFSRVFHMAVPSHTPERWQMSKFSKLNDPENSIDPDELMKHSPLTNSTLFETGSGNIPPWPFVLNQFSTKLHPAKWSPSRLVMNRFFRKLMKISRRTKAGH